jgi:hypothetical protein
MQAAPTSRSKTETGGNSETRCSLRTLHAMPPTGRSGPYSALVAAPPFFWNGFMPMSMT